MKELIPIEREIPIKLREERDKYLQQRHDVSVTYCPDTEIFTLYKKKDGDSKIILQINNLGEMSYDSKKLNSQKLINIVEKSVQYTRIN
tara:strand:- start:313 stop:579 length:267 start_codon:yes stop_codon:yes gene_type:complete